MMINVYCFKLLSFGVTWYAVITNAQNVIYLSIYSCKYAHPQLYKVTIQRHE